MTEYISRNKLLEERILHTYYHLKNGDTAIPIIDIKNASTEDVVERSKIDKAIEEINDAPVLFVDFPLGKAQVLRKDVVLDILKRNIGE